jgi:hypothetical protein
MSTTETAAPVSTDTAAASTDAAATSNGSTAAAADNDWTAALPEDTRATVTAKGWKSPGDAVKSYTDLMREYTETKTKALIIPADDAKPEDWKAFHAKMGVPEKPEGYDFKLPEGLPENLPYDGKNAEKFKLWAHEAGLSPKQAAAVHDKYMQDYAGTLGELQAANAKAVETAHDAIVKSWGDPSTDAYKRNTELANRAIRNLGGTELLNELKSIGAFGPNGEVKSPRLALAFAKMGEENYAEDSLFGGVGTGVNPFSEKTENLTKQGEIIRDDPARARVLIAQAGINPKEYGL